MCANTQVSLQNFFMIYFFIRFQITFLKECQGRVFGDELWIRNALLEGSLIWKGGGNQWMFLMAPFCSAISVIALCSCLLLLKSTSLCRWVQVAPLVVKSNTDHHYGNILNMFSCQLEWDLSTLCSLHSPQLSSVTSQDKERYFNTVILVTHPACFAQ